MKRIRGRRIALLIASALPLLAEDEIAPLTVNRTTTTLPPTSSHTSTTTTTPNHSIVSSSSSSTQKSRTASFDIDTDEHDVSDRPVRRSSISSSETVNNDDDDAAEISHHPHQRHHPSVVQATPTAQSSQSSMIIGSDVFRWGSLDYSLFSNDSILPFFPLDQEFEMAPFRRRGSRYPPRDGSRPSENTSHKSVEGNIAVWSDSSSRQSISPQPKSPISEKGKKEHAVDTVVIVSPTVDDSSLFTKETSSDDGNVKHVAVDFASKSAGAMILGSSANFKGSSNLLQTDRDKYAIVPCSEPSKYVVIGLSEDILVKEIVVANYERYSSHMKEIRVLGSATAAVGSNNWIDLGTYTTTMIGSTQAHTFPLSQPTWARYLKVEFVSHHGNEFYCTVSQISVHGSTVLQGFHEQWNEDDSSSSNNNRTPDDSSAIDVVDERKDTDERRPETKPENTKSNTVEQEDIALAETVAPSDTLVREQAETEDEIDVSSTIDRCILRSWNACFDGMNFTQQMEDFARIGDGQTGSLPVVSITRASKEAIGARFNCTRKMSSNKPLLTFASTETAVEQNVWKKGKDVRQIPTMKSTHVVDEFYKSNPGLFVSDEVLNRFRFPSEGPVAFLFGEKSGKQHVDPTQATSEATIMSESLKSKTKSAVDASTAIIMPNTEKSASKTVVVPTRRDSLDVSTVQEDELEATGLALAKVLQRLPNSKCLESLSFSSLKSSSLKGRTGSGSSTGGASGANMEPVFKKLADEIRALQASVAVHDEFAKESISCYQRVMLDMLYEMESVRSSQEMRLSQIENDLRLGVLAVAAQQCLTSFVLGVRSYIWRLIQFCVSLAEEEHNETQAGLLVAGGVVISFIYFTVTLVLIRCRRKKS